MIALAAAVSVTAFCTVCTEFWSYDDMGFLMLTQKTLAAGHPLYDQTFTAYGPAYYAWAQFLRTATGLPLSHDTTFLFTTLAVVVASLLCAGYVARLSRNLFLTALTLLATATLLLVMKSEPGHPQELCALLLTGMLAGAAFLGVARRPAILLGLIGLLVGALSMTKPNLGVFAAVAASASLSRMAPAGRVRTAWFGLSGLAALILPVALMRHNLPEVAGYCVIESAAILFLLLHLVAWKPDQRLTWRSFGVALIGFATALLACSAYALVTGTTLPGLAYGLFLQHLAFDQLFSFYSPFANRDILLPLCVAVGAWVATGPARHVWKPCPWIPDALKFAVAPFMIFAVLKLGITPAFMWCLPLVAATAGPSPRQPQSVDEQGPRYFALSLAVMNALWGYPVWGSQAGLSFFLLIPVAMVSCADAVRYGFWCTGRPASSNSARPWSTPVLWCFPRGRTGFKALYLVMAVAILGLALLQANQAAAAYRRLEPSGLPGSRLLHLPREQADFYRQIIRSAQAHGRSFFTMPGLGSLYFWANADPPTCIHPTTWMTLLTPAQQTKVVSDLEKAPGLCIIRWNPLIEFWTQGRDISGNKVVRYIEDNFLVAESFNGCDILMRTPAGSRPPEP